MNYRHIKMRRNVSIGYLPVPVMADGWHFSPAELSTESTDIDVDNLDGFSLLGAIL
jgi:hypothetical protein